MPVIGLIAASPAMAQDMMGPDWLKLLMAFPRLVLYAIGEFALFLVPVLVLLAVAGWVVRRLGVGGVRVLDPKVIAVVAAITAIPALLYGLAVPDRGRDPASPPPVILKPERKFDPLPPPVGKAWPRDTRYLDMPQGPQDGRGTIVVSGTASFRRHYVKLCVARQAACPGLRHAVLQKHSRFTFGDLPRGDYEVRYMPIDHPTVGGRSQPITIEGYGGESFTVNITDSPVLDSKHPVVGILLRDF